VLVLVNTTPFFVPIVAYFLFKSKTHFTLWIGIGIGFMGITFILHPDQEMLHFSSSLALLSGILGAIGISLVRALSKVGSLKQILFYNFFLATIIAGIISIFSWTAITGEDFLILLGVGICGALYQLFSTLTYKKIPVRVSSSFMFLCILFGALLDWIVLGLIPLRESLIGMGLVILGGLWIFYFGRRHIFIHRP
jgi:drug/metabolite transporter (DMT)-like permease